MTPRRRAVPYLLAAIAAADAAACAAQEDPPAKPPGPAPPASGEVPMEPDDESERRGEEPAKRRENRLAKEASPYLRQHMHNPVDWHAWGDEAFERARKEEKPVFLSIGYSTCHWCHVMERESFEDEDVAKVMNELFVCVKVDREERPDVDSVYMSAVQAMAGQGGWPLSVFLTPDRRPFFGGTYFPPEDRHGRPGFTTVLERIAQVWKERRGDALESAEQVATALREQAAAAAKGDLTPEPLAEGAAAFSRAFDDVHGGHGAAPKFPRAFVLSFLLQRSRATGSKDLVAQVEKSLDGMRRGGIHDHLGGGFHRYSTDREWLLPHFEKMLYDQAAAVDALVDAWLVTRNPLWERTARGAIEYVLRDLRDPAGGFHSAEDADSEGEEGKFYVWTKAEIVRVLGEEDGALLARVYAAADEGNYVDEARRTRTGANILHLAAPVEHHAKMLGTDAAKLEARLVPLRAKLLAERSKRVRPHLDDKVLADWNGLMIGAMARAGAAFGDERFVGEAARAADFVLTEMRREGRLFHRWRAGDLAIPAFLDDHAYLALGLADLYEVTFDARWLAASRDLLRTAVAEFRDADGAFRLVSARGEALIVATRELYDGALPSGNSVVALALLRVGRVTGDSELEDAGRSCLEAWSAHLEAQPSAFPFALLALEFALGPTREVVVAGDPADPATQALVAEVRKRFLPDTVVLLHPPGAAGAAIEALAPYVKSQGPLGGKPAAYVCRDRTCAAPVTTPAELAALLDAGAAPAEGR